MLNIKFAISDIFLFLKEHYYAFQINSLSEEHGIKNFKQIRICHIYKKIHIIFSFMMSNVINTYNVFIILYHIIKY